MSATEALALIAELRAKDAFVEGRLKVEHRTPGGSIYARAADALESMPEQPTLADGTLAEADRRAGAALRELANLRERERKETAEAEARGLERAARYLLAKHQSFQGFADAIRSLADPESKASQELGGQSETGPRP